MVKNSSKQIICSGILDDAYLLLIQVASLSIIFYFIQLFVVCPIFEVLLTRFLIFSTTELFVSASQLRFVLSQQSQFFGRPQEIQFVDHYCHPFRHKRSTSLILSNTFFTKHSILILRCSRRATEQGCPENSDQKNKTISYFKNSC